MSGLHSTGIKSAPAGCRAVVEERPRGFRITIPARGLVRGAGCGFLFATPLVIAVTILLAVVSYYNVPTHGGVPVPQIRHVPPAVFAFVSIVLVLAMINLAGRRVFVSVLGDMLWVEGTQPLFPTKRGEWKRSQLFAICAGPHCRLEVHSRNRPTFTLFYPGPGLELEWLASILRRALQLESASCPATASISRRATASAGAVAARWVAPGSEADDNRMEIAASLVGAVLSILVWFVFHRGSSLQDLDWLWSSLGPYILAGAAVGLSGALLHRAFRRRYLRRLAEISRSMKFTFQPEMLREDIGNFFYLRLFREYDSSARNRMTGVVDGLRVDMFDYTFAAGSGEKKQPYRQTVMLLPAPEGLPAFELRPRHRGEWFVSSEISFLEDRPNYRDLRKNLGRHGYQLFLRDYARARPIRECIQRFNRQYEVHRYYLSEYFEQAALWRLSDQPATGLGPDRAARAEDIRAFFTLDVLRYFADRPGWRIESDGVHLAMWRSKGFLSAAERPRFVAEALEVYGVLSAGTTAASTPSQAVEEASAVRHGRYGFLRAGKRQ